MNKRWTKFEGRQYHRTNRKEPRVTLGPHGVLYLNGKAFEAIRRPAAVELLYDGNERVIGVRKCDARQYNAFLVRPHGKGGKTVSIRAAAFCKHYRLQIRRTMLFHHIEIDSEGILHLPLTSTTCVGRGGS